MEEILSLLARHHETMHSAFEMNGIVLMTMDMQCCRVLSPSTQK
jgi:hypothetical protein